MADIVTTEQLQNASLDTQTLEKFVNGDENTVNNPRLMPNVDVGSIRALNKKIAADAQVQINAAKDAVDQQLKTLPSGHKGYATLADAQAAQASLPANTLVEVTNDSDTAKNGVYLWNGTTLTKSTYDVLSQAKADATTKANTAEANAKTYADTNKLDLSKIATEYVDGNKIGAKTPRYTNLGLSSAFAIQAATNYDSLVLSVKTGDVLFLLNDKQNYSASSGAGFAFFAEDPNINRTQARITDNRVSAIDSATTLSHQKVTVPAGAKYLMINTRFTNASASRTDFTWAVHSFSFSNSYATGIEVISSINNTRVSASEDVKRVKPQILSEANQYTDSKIDIKSMFDGGNLVRNIGINYTSFGITSSAISTSANLDSVVVPVSEGDTLFMFNTANSYVGSYGYARAFFAEDPNVNRTQTRIEFTSESKTDLISGQSYTQVTVPSGANYLMLNTRFQTTNIVWAVHSGKFSPSYEMGAEYIKSINGLSVGSEPEALPIDMLKHSAYRFYGKKVFCFGDSITQGTEGGYVKYLAETLGCEILNYGSSGAATNRIVDIVTAGSGIPKRDNPTAETVWATKDYTQCAAVTIQIGTNGYNGGALSDIPLGNISDYTNPLEYWALFPALNYYSNIGLCIEYIRSINSECEIFLITPPYRHITSDGVVDTPERMSYLIPMLKEIADYYSVKLINSMQESGIGFKYMKPNIKYSYDGIHFNELGNKLWGKYIARKILSGS